MTVAPLPKPPARAALGRPPEPEAVRDNLRGPKETQLNVRLDPQKHAEIKIAAIKAGMSLAEYVIMLHDDYQESKKGA